MHQSNVIIRSGDSAKEDKYKFELNNNDIDYSSHVKNHANIEKDAVRYVEINPLGLQQKYSKTLVYIITVAYSLMPLSAAIVFFTLLILLFTRFFFITLIYAAYVYLNRKKCNQGGKRVDFIFRSKIWSYLAAYFPIKLRHSTDFALNPNKNYILNYHPHGIAAFGAVTTFATNGLNFSELFPEITSRFMVHETSFFIPLMREIFISRGDCSVNSKSIDFLLSSDKGNLLAIVGGGLAEADLSDQKTLKIVVKERKGFVKKALIHGADLIPCIAFGENSVFEKVNFDQSSFMYRFETKFYKMFGFKHPIYYGQSIFSSKRRGVVPHKRPITVVMGNPIEVELNENPSQQDIDQVHRVYIEHLQSIYDANKDLCRNFDTEIELK